MAAESGCVWLYAVIDDVGSLPSGELTGVGGSVVRALWAGGLAAIVGDVDQREFGEAALRRNLEDLGWLERTARAHHAVIDVVGRRCPVVPMRLATVFSSDAGVLTTLRDRAAAFRSALSRLAACREWGVKAFAVSSAESGTAPSDLAGRPGTAYLQRRRAQLTAQTDARQEAMAGARAVHAELSRLAVSSRLYPPQASSLAGRAAHMVLNASYLVADEREGEFAAKVDELTGSYPSVRLSLTGPWPAYSFTDESGTSSDTSAHASGERR